MYRKLSPFNVFLWYPLVIFLILGWNNSNEKHKRQLVQNDNIILTNNATLYSTSHNCICEVDGSGEIN